MAINIINKNQTILNNNISDQVLSHANQLTTKAWNDIINSLRTQANVNAMYISTLHKWLIGAGEGSFIIPDEKSFVEFVFDYIESNPIQKEDNDDALYITDNSGNIIARIDSGGLHTTNVYLHGKEVALKEMTFTGTMDEYESANANGKIPIGAIVNIVDDEE